VFLLNQEKKWGMITAGGIAGLINGLFGAGGGMVLVPLLTKLTNIADKNVFPTSVSIILPVCLVSLGFTIANGSVNTDGVLPYLIGSTLGGVAAGFFGKKIPTLWLHKTLGILILWGGIRYLC
jgi:uncharacterized membrane protein YfcA